MHTPVDVVKMLMGTPGRITPTIRGCHAQPDSVGGSAFSPLSRQPSRTPGSASQSRYATPRGAPVQRVSFTATTPGGYTPTSEAVAASPRQHAMPKPVTAKESSAYKGGSSHKDMNLFRGMSTPSPPPSTRMRFQDGRTPFGGEHTHTNSLNPIPGPNPNPERRSCHPGSHACHAWQERHGTHIRSEAFRP